MSSFFSECDMKMPHCTDRNHKHCGACPSRGAECCVLRKGQTSHENAELSFRLLSDQSAGGSTKHPLEALCLHSCCFRMVLIGEATNKTSSLAFICERLGAL